MDFYLLSWPDIFVRPMQAWHSKRNTVCACLDISGCMQNICSRMIGLTWNTLYSSCLCLCVLRSSLFFFFCCFIQVICCVWLLTMYRVKLKNMKKMAVYFRMLKYSLCSSQGINESNTVLGQMSSFLFTNTKAIGGLGQGCLRFGSISETQ